MNKKELEELIKQYANPAMRMGNKEILKELFPKMRKACEENEIEIPYWLED